MNEDTIKQMAAQVADLHTHIIGKPGESDRGLLVRVDRLEQKSKILQWVSGTAIGTAITTGITVLITKIIGTH